MLFRVFEGCIGLSWPLPYINNFDYSLSVAVMLYDERTEIFYPKFQPNSIPVGMCGDVTYNWINPLIVVSDPD